MLESIFGEPVVNGSLVADADFVARSGKNLRETTLLELPTNR